MAESEYQKLKKEGPSDEERAAEKEEFRSKKDQDKHDAEDSKDELGDLDVSDKEAEIDDEESYADDEEEKAGDDAGDAKKEIDKEDEKDSEDPEDDEDEDENSKKEKPVKESELSQEQLIIDEAYEMQSEVVEEINESGHKKKNYYIEGIFSTPDKKNRNGRVYSSKLWEKNVQMYQKHITENTRNSLGELEHPSRIAVDPMKAVMKITSLKMENGIVKGRAKILNDNSPETNKLKALIDEGIQIGVSSRGSGRMKGSIVEEFELSTYDIVQSPSDYNAMLGGIVESIEKPIVTKQGQKLCEGECPIKEENPIETKKFSKLVEAFDKYTKEEKVVSEAEQKAIALIEVMKRKKFKVTGTGMEAVVKQFWDAANNLKAWVKDDKKMYSQLASAFDDVAEIIDTKGK